MKFLKLQKGDAIKFNLAAVKKHNFPEQVLYYVDTIVSEDGKKLYMLGGWGEELILAEEDDIDLVPNESIEQRILNVLVDVAQTLKATHYSLSEMKKGMNHEHDENDMEGFEEIEQSADLEIHRKKRYTQ